MTDRQIKKATKGLPLRPQVPWHEWTPEQQRLSKELDCRKMINSILCYHDEAGLQADAYSYNRYVLPYADDIGLDTVHRLCDEQVEDFRKAVVCKNAFRDGEGLSYNSVMWADELIDVVLDVLENDLNEEGPEMSTGYTLPNGEYHIFAYVDFIDDEKVIVLEPNKVVDGAHEPIGGDTFIVGFEDTDGLWRGCDWCLSQFALDKYGFDAVLTAACERSAAIKEEDGDMRVFILQVKHGEEYRNERFAALSYLEKGIHSVKYQAYDNVYSFENVSMVDFADETAVQRVLEGVFQRFNWQIPADYKGRSLSVSDVVVLRSGDAHKAFYCDSWGFKELPGEFVDDFLKDNCLLKKVDASYSKAEIDKV